MARRNARQRRKEKAHIERVQAAREQSLITPHGLIRSSTGNAKALKAGHVISRATEPRPAIALKLPDMQTLEAQAKSVKPKRQVSKLFAVNNLLRGSTGNEFVQPSIAKPTAKVFAPNRSGDKATRIAKVLQDRKTEAKMGVKLS